MRVLKRATPTGTRDILLYGHFQGCGTHTCCLAFAWAVELSLPALTILLCRGWNSIAHQTIGMQGERFNWLCHRNNASKCEALLKCGGVFHIYLLSEINNTSNKVYAYWWLKVFTRSCVRIPTSDNLTLLNIRLNLQKFKKMITFQSKFIIPAFTAQSSFKQTITLVKANS